ncbi:MULTISPECIES: carbohydrate ABC transporter permease [unclassified Oceanispirochaeta]|uniref:carbohydrate ABC transporter permease n=1 Tax=unclassified Oceanispirochaeta TaxID=2635722 RepID=UPI000E09450F|nr:MULTISPECIES: sugar ABC transporter permease [unclassified Oceanispirochaeta]MBF9017534.1 sugar ABC transporter permease [Oceanispirochaeta sp. M2]NPD74106.1 sugar ABC transporter permease [Oceanispirochaeta sp. M1]RDG30028.1 sugar ABC transporter permease [Oceanispirochaeta sp. M1]
MTRKQMGYLFVIPTMFLFLVLAIYPVFKTLYLSFFEYRLQFGEVKTFIGFNNFIKLFTTERFYTSFKFTILFTITTVTVEVGLGLLFAQFMNMDFKGKSLLRIVVLIPWAIPTIVSGFIWRFMVNDQYGVVNQILQNIGLIESFIPWLSRSGTASAVLIFADIWKTAPYVSLLVLAGLQNINESLLEAASIDGAGKIKTYRYITLPALKPVLATAVLFRLIQSFKVYTIIVALTNGGPANSTESLTLYTLRTYFDSGNYGYGSALASFTFVVTVLIALMFLRVIQNKISN